MLHGRSLIWSRGFVEGVTARSEEVWEERNIGRSNSGVYPTETVPTPWVRAIVTAIPTLREIRITDSAVVERTKSEFYISNLIPEPIVERCEIGASVYHDTHEAAVAALSRAVCEWVRNEETRNLYIKEIRNGSR